MTVSSTRWAVLGTAAIARSAFLPALREAGGTALTVAGRDGATARDFAAEHGVLRGVEGYVQALLDPDVDAVYVALPNALHAEWTQAALAAGKAVLCEKPLCVSVPEAERVLEVAQAGLLWEAFVFPFQAQHRHLKHLIADGAIGELREITSAFHFRLTDPDNIRLSAQLGGGCLADVGCYPVRLAQLLFGAEPDRVQASAIRSGGVEVDAAALMDYPDGRRLGFTCGFRRSPDTHTRLLGTAGTIEVANPYHPTRSDTVVLLRAGHEPVVERPTVDERSFTAALRHIGAVVGHGAAPEHLATIDSTGTARTLTALAAAR